MILNKSKQLPLISKISTQVKANALSVAVLQPVIESFVVAKVEALLLQFPFQVPICFCDEKKSGMAALDGRDHVLPIF